MMSLKDSDPMQKQSEPIKSSQTSYSRGDDAEHRESTNHEYWNNMIQRLSRQKAGTPSMARIRTICKTLLDKNDAGISPQPTILSLSNTFSKETQNELVLLIAHLPFNTTVLELYLRENQIGPDTCAILTKALQDNSSIVFLSLGENRIGDEGAMAFGSLLSHVQCSIQKLSLEENKIDNEGIILLAKGMEKNHSVKQLFLYKNRFGDKGTESLGTMLRYNQHLEELYISKNCFGDMGAKYIATGLQYNSTLKKLVYSNSTGSGGGMGIDGSRWFSTMLKVNRGLRTLIVGCEKMGKEGQNVLVEGLEHNFYLEEFYFFNAGTVCPTLRIQIDFFCQLNKMGRRILREENVPLAVWAEILSKVPKRNPSLLYYFIQAKPDLFKCLHNTQ